MSSTRRPRRPFAPGRLRRSSTLRDQPEVQAHLHTHSNVEQEHLDAFTRAPKGTQLLVLAELRLRAEDQEATLVLGLEAAALAIFAVLASVAPVDLATVTARHVAPGLASQFNSIISFAAYAVITIAIIAPSVIHAVRSNRDHGRAVVWLHAYEQALEERLHRRGERRRFWMSRR